jgi:hypothetical protein
VRVDVGFGHAARRLRSPRGPAGLGAFGTGWFYRWFLGAFIASTAAGLAAHAATRPKATPDT